MTARKVLASAVGISVLGVLALALAEAQAPGGGRGDGRDPRQMRGQFDPEQMRGRMMERIKEVLEPAEDAWSVLEPRLERVISLSREVDGFGRGAMFGGRRAESGGRMGAAAMPRSQSDVARAMQELQATVDKPGSTPEEIKAKLTALRKAREQAKQELARARKAVRELVTQRQEAQLVLMGILD